MEEGNVLLRHALGDKFLPEMELVTIVQNLQDQMIRIEYADLMHVDLDKC